MSPNLNSQEPEAAPSTAERQAQALYDFLHGLLPQDDPDVPAGEAELGKALRALADETQPGEEFDASLQEVLKVEARRGRAKVAIGSLGRTLGWAVMLLILVLGLGWAIRNLLPNPVSLETGTQVGPGVVTATLVKVELPTVTPGCSPVRYVVSQGDTLRSIASLFGVTADAILEANHMTDPGALYVGQVLSIPKCPLDATAVPTQPDVPLQVYTSPLMPDLEIVMQAEFPETPEGMAVYEQLPWEKLTLDAARQAAIRLGLPGAAFKPAHQNSWDTNFTFTDGFGRVDFTNNIYQYYYVTDYSAALKGDVPLPLTSAQIAEIEAYLKERGLLDFPYQVEEPAYSGQINGVAAFVQMLDGYAIRTSGFYGPRLSVTTNSQGKVKTIDSSRVNFQVLGTYGIRSAEEAWQKAIAPDMPMGVELNTFAPPSSIPPRWQRTYPMGERVEVYGSLEILQPAEAGGAAQLFLENVPLRGNVQGMEQLSDSQQFVQVWGQFQPGETGERVFEVEGWQVSPLPGESVIGLIEREGEKVYLSASDRRLLLMDVPDALLDGTQVSVTGVVLPESAATADSAATPVLEWSWIYAGPLGGGGGGGGASFLDLNLGGPPVPTPTPYPMPTVQAGTRLEGVTGNPIVTIREYEDGSRKLEVDMYIEPSSDWPEGLSLRLEGAAVDGLEAYHMLPVRIWGTLTGRTAGMIVYLDLERYEPVYPGVKMQAWLGKLEGVTLEGKNVVRFTVQDGQQYILNSSLMDESSFSWAPQGQDMIVEGAVFPDKTFAGYPVLQDYGYTPAGGIKDVSQYQMQRVLPQIVKETGSASLPRQAVIEKIELVYHTIDLRNLGDVAPEITYIQPMWRFVGHYPDGTVFEFLVQALLDEYLKPWE